MIYKPYFLNDVYNNSKKELFTVISTFAGGGGSSTGYKLAGGKVLAMNEFVDEAVKTYTENYPDVKVISGDIKTINASDFFDITNIKKHELDIFDGSPPCSAFSVAGQCSKGWNKEKTYSDNKKVKNIEDLFLEFIRIADDLQSKVIIIENVVGLTIGDSKSKLYEMLNSLDDIGYYATYKILNASNFDTPQARKRVFIIGVRKDVLDDLDLPDIILNSIVYPKPNDYFYSIKDAINDIDNDAEEEDMLLKCCSTGFHAKFVPLLEFNPIKAISPGDIEFRDVNPKGSFFSMIRPAPLKPCPTITQRGQQTRVSGILHYSKNRKLTVKELKRVQGLPDDYILTGNFNKQAERICRVVAPLCMKALSSHIYETILKPYNNLEKKTINLT